VSNYVDRGADRLIAGLDMTVPIPQTIVDAIAERAAALVLEELEHSVASASPFLTAPEAAQYLRCEPQRIYELRSSGRLRGFKEGGRVLFAREDVERLVVASPRAA
jgi:excisionase family DNA binding protein